MNNLKEKAELIGLRSTELSNRLEGFQEVLSKLPGRTETRFDAIKVRLWFRREGRKWELLACEPDSENFRPLSNCPLKLRIAAIDVLADFMFAMSANQDAILTSISEAIDKFDRFAKELKL